MKTASITSILASGRSPAPSIPLQLVVQGDPVNIENIGCPTLVASAVFEDAQDVSSFDFVQALPCRARRSLLVDEVLLAKFRILSDDHRPLDGVLQFSNISHPRLLLQLLQGAGRDAGNLLVHGEGESADEVFD